MDVMASELKHLANDKLIQNKVGENKWMGQYLYTPTLFVQLVFFFFFFFEKVKSQ